MTGPATCESCGFWQRSNAVDGEAMDGGECRRRAPVPAALPCCENEDAGPPVFAAWPVTFEGDWCGESAGAPADAGQKG